MKRAEKVALLTKVVQGKDTQVTRRLLQQLQDKTPRSLLLIDDLDTPGQPIEDTDTVHFQDRGKNLSMTLSEAKQYATRYGVSTLFVLPAKRL